MNLRNTLVSIDYREEKKEIFVRDLTDLNNEPALFTKSKRGLKKAVGDIVNKFNDKMNFSHVWQILLDNKIKTHYWCMVD